MTGTGAQDPGLYRQERLPQASLDGATVFVVEGEKDVHSLEALGRVAVTGPHGAGKAGGQSKWRPEYGQAFRGVFLALVLRDNDSIGREHGENVARSISREGVPVKIVDFPELQEHGDVTDWIAGGHTREQLLERVAEAPVYVPPADSVAITDDDEPLPPVETPAEPFPIEVFPDPVRRFIEEVSASIPGAPLDYPAGAVLAVAASAIGASRQIELKESYRESAALWVAIDSSRNCGVLGRSSKPMPAVSRWLSICCGSFGGRSPRQKLTREASSQAGHSSTTSNAKRGGYTRRFRRPRLTAGSIGS